MKVHLAYTSVLAIAGGKKPWTHGYYIPPAPISIAMALTDGGHRTSIAAIKLSESW